MNEIRIDAPTTDDLAHINTIIHGLYFIFIHAAIGAIYGNQFFFWEPTQAGRRDFQWTPKIS